MGNPVGAEPAHPAPVWPGSGGTKKEYQRVLYPDPAGESAGHRAALRAKMLGIDTILETVCIVEKSIYSGGLANVGRRPAFFMR